MTINLHDYVGNTVVVNFRDGSTWTASLKRHDSTHYPFLLTKDDSDFYHTYTNDGHIWSNKEDHDYDIVSIRYSETPMNINLEQFVDQTVVIDFDNAPSLTGTISRNSSENYPYKFVSLDESDYHTYTQDGYIWRAKVHSNNNIKKIRKVYDHPPQLSRLAELQKQEKNLKKMLQETQTQLEKVQAQIEQAERDRLPKKFSRECALRFLAEPTNVHALDWAFEWLSTPQGYVHWAAISRDPTKLTSEDIIQIQTWIIQSFYETENASS